MTPEPELDFDQDIRTKMLNESRMMGSTGDLGWVSRLVIEAIW
jgi:hypothetical protein